MISLYNTVFVLVCNIMFMLVVTHLEKQKQMYENDYKWRLSCVVLK